MNTDTTAATTTAPKSCPTCRKATMVTDAPGLSHCFMCHRTVRW